MRSLYTTLLMAAIVAMAGGCFIEAKDDADRARPEDDIEAAEPRDVTPTEEGAFERLGARMDKGAKKLDEKLEKGAGKLGEALEKTGREMQEKSADSQRRRQEEAADTGTAAPDPDLQKP